MNSPSKILADSGIPTPNAALSGVLCVRLGALSPDYEGCRVRGQSQTEVDLPLSGDERVLRVCHARIRSPREDFLTLYLLPKPVPAPFMAQPFCGHQTISLPPEDAIAVANAMRGVRSRVEAWKRLRRESADQDAALTALEGLL